MTNPKDLKRLAERIWPSNDWEIRGSTVTLVESIESDDDYKDYNFTGLSDTDTVKIIVEFGMDIENSKDEPWQASIYSYEKGKFIRAEDDALNEAVLNCALAQMESER